MRALCASAFSVPQLLIVDDNLVNFLAPTVFDLFHLSHVSSSTSSSSATTILHLFTGDGADKNHSNTSRYRHGYTPQHARRAISGFIVVLLVLVGITALVLWLVYRPHKPKFTVVGAAVYELNTSSPPYIFTTMQFTLVTRNPNDRVSIYYDHLTAFLSYKDQAITPPLMLPPLYHGTDRSVVVSPIFGGGAIPVSPEVISGLETDEAFGAVSLRVILTGKLRWKAAGIKTGRKGIYVGCDVLVGFKKGAVGQVPLLGSSSHGCNVDM